VILCSLEIELAETCFLGLLEKVLCHGLNILVRALLRHVLDQTDHGLPVLIALVLFLHLLEIEKQAFLLSGGPEVELHASVVAVREASLGLRHPIVELAIEVGQALLVELAAVHAVGEDYAASSLLIKVLLVDLI
jgi:hypothetical protein